MKQDWDTTEQINAFHEYLVNTCEDRMLVHGRFGYNEEEWEAFQYGWNAAKKYFGIKE